MSDFLSTKILGDLTVTGTTKLKGLSLTDLIVNGTTTLNGETTVNNTMKLPDNIYLYFGDGNDGYFYSDGTNSQGNINIMTIKNKIRLPQGIASSDPVITNVSDGDTGINFPVAAQIDLITSSVPRISVKDNTVDIKNRTIVEAGDQISGLTTGISLELGSEGTKGGALKFWDSVSTGRFGLIHATSGGNLHIDSDAVGKLYLNHYVSGEIMLQSNTRLQDNKNLYIGNDSDGKIYSNGTTSYAEIDEITASKIYLGQLGEINFDQTSGQIVKILGFSGGLSIYSDNEVKFIESDASNEAITFTLNDGYIFAERFVDKANTSYYLDPANTGTSLNTAGDINLNSGKAYRWLSGNAEIRENSYDLIFKNWDGIDSLDENMRIKSGGNVGIGTNNPLAKLHGVGTLRFDLGDTYTITDVPSGTIMFGNASNGSNVPSMVSRSDSNIGFSFETRTLDTKTSIADMMFNIRENDNTDYATLTGGGFAFRRYTTDLMTIDRAGNVMILGDLQVTGTTTTNNVEMVSTSNGIVFEGTVVDDFELTLLAGDLTADRTVTLKDRSGTILLAEDLQDYTISPKFGATIGMGNDSQVLYFNDANNETLTNYWTSKDGFEIRGDSNLINNIVLKTGNLYLSQNGYINGNLGINGSIKFETANQRNALNLNNNKIIGVDSLALSDSGPDGYVQMGSWSIWNSPNDLTTNSDGNFQFVTGGVRKVTINTAGQLELPVATGTSPLIVASTTKVDNLNVEYLNGQLGSYYLNWENVSNKPDPVITLAGDLTGSVTLTDLNSGTLTATIAANSVALGTDTTGNYVATISPTTNGGIIINNSGTENAAVTLGHSNIITAGNFGDTGLTRALEFGGAFIVPYVSYDINGHIISKSDLTLTMPSNPNTWRTIEVNNTTIGSDILDLTNGTNVTLTNTSGVVTFSSPSLSKVDGTGDFISDITVSGHTITEVKGTWPTFNQNTTGTAAKSDTIKTVAIATNANFYPTFVDSNNGTAAYESVYTDGGLYYNPSTDTLFATNLNISGTQTINNVSLISTSSGIIFEGSTDDEFETTLNVINPTADRTVVLPDASGTVALTNNINNGALTLEAGTYLTRSDSNGSFSANQSIDEIWTINHDNSGVTAGTYGEGSTRTLAYGGTFKIPKLVIDAQGHTTSAVDYILTLPASDNTDTHYTASNFIGSVGTMINSATANGSTYLKLVENSIIRSSHLITGTGATTVISDANGNITINSIDTNDNTATAVDNILDGSNSGTAITYAPYTSQQTKLSLDTSSTLPNRTDRLNLNGNLYTTQLNTNKIGGVGTELRIGAGEALSSITGTAEAVYIAGESGVIVYASSDNLTSGLNRSSTLIDTAGDASFGANVTVAGNLTVNGTTVTLNTSEWLVEDKNITLGNVDVPTDITADGGGITLRGDTNKTITWANSTDSWNFNQNLILDSGKKIGLGINPLSPLHIKIASAGTEMPEGMITIENTTVSGEAAIRYINEAAATAGAYWYNGLNNSNSFRITYGTSNTDANARLSIDTAGNAIFKGNVTGAEFIVPDATSKGLTNVSGDAHLHVEDASGNFHLKSTVAGGMYFDSQTFNFRDNDGSPVHLTMNSGAATFTPSVVITNTTAGSSTTGALKVTGGIGQTGEYTNYLEGATTINDNLTVNGTISYNDVSRYWLNTATNWGIYWDTTDNRIEFHGSGTDRAGIDLDTGDADFSGEVSTKAIYIETWKIQKDATTNSLKFIFG